MVNMGEVVSAIVQNNMPLKQKDPGVFTIPCVIGNAGFKRALCDLGASISVMLKHVYDSFSLEPLNKTSIVIQLADRSFVYLVGVIEDVLVKIDSLVIPCDFYILDMEHDSCDSSNNTLILFGRPLLKIANTKIDCGKDTLSIEVGDEKIEFNFHDAMTYPYSNVYAITCYDQVDKCVQQVCDFDSEDGLSVALSYDYDFTKIEEMERHICVPKTCMNQHWLCKLCKLFPMMQESFTPSWTMNGWRLSFWCLKILELYWKKYKMMLMRMQGFIKKRLRVSMTE